MPQTASGYSDADLAYFREHYGETDWMIHVQGPDEVLLYSDETDEVEGETEYTEETAFAAAAAINKIAADLLAGGDENTPRMHASVFHRGVPAPEQAGAR